MDAGYDNYRTVARGSGSGASSNGNNGGGSYSYGSSSGRSAGASSLAASLDAKSGGWSRRPPPPVDDEEEDVLYAGEEKDEGPDTGAESGEDERNYDSADDHPHEDGHLSCGSDDEEGDDGGLGPLTGKHGRGYGQHQADYAYPRRHRSSSSPHAVGANGYDDRAYAGDHHHDGDDDEDDKDGEGYRSNGSHKCDICGKLKADTETWSEDGKYPVRACQRCAYEAVITASSKPVGSSRGRSSKSSSSYGEY